MVQTLRSSAWPVCMGCGKLRLNETTCLLSARLRLCPRAPFWAERRDVPGPISQLVCFAQATWPLSCLPGLNWISPAPGILPAHTLARLVTPPGPCRQACKLAPGEVPSSHLHDQPCPRKVQCKDKRQGLPPPPPCLFKGLTCFLPIKVI